MKIKQFSREVKDELNKVVWPDRKSAIQTTIMVMIMTVVVAVFFLIVDTTLSAIVNQIF